MRISGIVATTEPVKRGDVYSRFSIEALENTAGMEGVPVIHGHNPLLLPLGKSERTWIEKSSDTEASLHQDMYIVTDEPDRFIHEFSRTPCVYISFADSPGKFVVNAPNEENSVTVDMSAVSKGSHEKLVREVRDYDEHVTLGFHDQQEELPIALIRFVADFSLADTLRIALSAAILKAGVDGTLARWTEDTVKWLKNDCVPVLKTYRRHKTEASISKGIEWIVLAFYAGNTEGPLIELVIPSKHDSELPVNAVEKFAERIDQFGDLLPDCDKVVFLYDPCEEKCEFRYALMKKGDVIGSEACYEDSIRPHKQWLAVKKEGTAVWWRLVTVDDGEYAMQLYLLGGDHPKLLGYLSMDSSVASSFLEIFDADDGILRPFHARDDGQKDSSNAT